MKRELFAAALLSLLCLFAAWNVHRVDQLTGSILQNLERAEYAMSLGNKKTAMKNFQTGFSIWKTASSYTNVFLRHPDVDAASDVFYELEGLLEQGDWVSLPAAFEKLRYHLRSLAYMEQPSLGTVF